MSVNAHPHWGAQALWDSLSPLLPDISIEVVSRVDSTNTRLLDRARAMSGQPDAPVTRPGEVGAPGLREHTHERTPHGRRAGDVSPCLLVAEEQARGRGRLGRDWVSSAGASLTFSLSMPLAPAQWGGLSLAVGLALAEALDPCPPAEAQDDVWGSTSRPRIGLKWPNDLWLWEGPGRGRKLGGVLIETVSVGQRRMCVVGVGLNVRPQPVAAGGVPLSSPSPSTSTSTSRSTSPLGSTLPWDAPSKSPLSSPLLPLPLPPLASGYACLQEIDAGATAARALAQVARPLVLALRRFESAGFAPLLPAYTRRDLLRGHAVSTSGPEPLHGVADGVDEQGALRVCTDEDGRTVQRIVSGEVSVRLRGAAA
ncbi:MAG: biotin--[acetyl-CoA-carboxylase] ligase [Rubrivivax sp.]|nr:biotin--[acetyl-CoA-carboxylase] ligase [Rubrivivax sp.]